MQTPTVSMPPPTTNSPHMVSGGSNHSQVAGLKVQESELIVSLGCKDHYGPLVINTSSSSPSSSSYSSSFSSSSPSSSSSKKPGGEVTYLSNYCLLNATLSNATETLVLALDKTKTGLTLQLHNMSLDQGETTMYTKCGETRCVLSVYRIRMMIPEAATRSCYSYHSLPLYKWSYNITFTNTNTPV